MVNDALSTASKKRRMFMNDAKGGGRDLFEGTVPEYACKTLKSLVVRIVRSLYQELNP
jgi:hypothetical protein